MQLEDTDSVTTTHALFALMMNRAAEANNMQQNKDRELRQRRVLRDFLHALAHHGFVLNDKHLYDLYCEFSYKHLSTYFPEDAPPGDVRFLPMDYMSAGDECHQKLCEYFRAQTIIYQEDPKTAPDVSRLPLLDILILCRDRLGRAE